MRLQLNNFGLLGVVLTLIVGCSNINKLDGDWSVIDKDSNYSEICFDENRIRIYTDIVGYIGSQSFVIEEDSLITNIIAYKFELVNKDSIILTSSNSRLHLKKIKYGFKLSEYNSENLEDSFHTSFYNRMYKLKGYNPKNESKSDSLPTIKEEIIEIKRK